MGIEPDTKDWTWVLHRRCGECGLVTADVRADRLPELLMENARAWGPVLTVAGAAHRPAPTIWSPLEYACHVRDVHRLFEARVVAMLDTDDPVLADWDQDTAARDAGYDLQDPAVVAVELLAAAERCAGRYAAVTDEQWRRTGRRSDGSRFTVESLGRYHLHDAVHHLHDVRS